MKKVEFGFPGSRALPRISPHELIDRLDQSIHMVVEIASSIDLGGVAERQILQRCGKRSGLWDARMINQDRDDRNVPVESRLDFDPHQIGLIACAAPRPVTDPARPDDRQQDVALAQDGTQVLAVIYAVGDAVNVQEY